MEEGLDLQYYINLVRRRFLILIGAFALVFGVFFAAAILLPPTFRSEAKILVEAQQIPADLVRSTVTSFADERLQIIKQRVTTRDALLVIADKFQLYAEARGKLSPSELVELLRERISITPFDLGARRGRDGAFTIAFTVGFEDGRADTAAKVANELVTLILNEDVRARTSRASETTQFLTREVERQQQELVTVETQIAAFKLENKDALPENVPFQMSALERSEKDLAGLDRDIASAEEEKRLLQFEFSIRAEGGSGAGGSDLRNVAQRLDALKAELAAKDAVYKASHPDIRSLKRQIAALERQMLPPAAAAGAATPVNLAPEALAKLDLGARVAAEKIIAVDKRRELLVKQRAGLATNLDTIRSLIAKVPEVQNGLSRLQRQRDGLQKSLDELSRKLGEARLGEKLEEDQQAERFEVIEQPVTPTDPVKPNRKKIIALGFVLAMAAAGGSVLGLESLDKSIRSSQDLARALGRAPLVAIPYFTTPREQQKQREQLKYAAAAAAAVCLVGLLAVHFLLMPLDLVAMKVMRRLEI